MIADVMRLPSPTDDRARGREVRFELHHLGLVDEAAPA